MTESDHLPPNLDQYLEEVESRFPDIKPGTEKTVSWISTTKTPTEYSVVYLHGYSSSRKDTEPLSRLVAQNLNANLFCTRLTGHGLPSDQMADVTTQDWLDDASEALEIGRRIGTKIVVIGLSTGGTLAAWLALKDTENLIHCLVLISPNFGPRNKASEILNWPLGKYIALAVEGKYRHWKPQNELHKQFWTISYPTVTLKPMMQIVKMVREADLGNLKTPVMLIHSQRDKVVDIGKMLSVYNRFGSETRREVVVTDAADPDQHVLAGDILSPNKTEWMADEIVKFVKNNSTT